MTACVMWSACAPTLEDVRGALAAGRPLDLLVRLGARWWAWGVTVRDGRVMVHGADAWGVVALDVLAETLRGTGAAWRFAGAPGGDPFGAPVGAEVGDGR